MLEEIGEGPASRMLLLAIGGSDPEAAAETSRALVAALRASPEFRWAANGESNLEAIPDRLLAYRYLLSPTLDGVRFDESFLRAAARGAPARPGLARRGVSRAVAAARSDARAPEARRVVATRTTATDAVRRLVRHDRAGRRLLVAETRAAGLRSAGPARRRRCAAGGVRAGPDGARARARGERPRRLLGAHEGSHPAGGAAARRARHARHGDAAARGLPQRARAGARPAAAGDAPASPASPPSAPPSARCTASRSPSGSP